MPPANQRRFAIGFSFPGEHRTYVEQVARALLAAFGGEEAGKARIFYDLWHESKIIGYVSNRKLQQIYAEHVDLVVPFYCKEYLKKKWCGVELRAIEKLLNILVSFVRAGRPMDPQMRRLYEQLKPQFSTGSNQPGHSDEHDPDAR